MAFRVVGIGLLGILLALAAQVGLLYKESLSALQASQDAPADYSCPKFDPDAAISRFRHLITFPSVSDVADPLHTGDKQALEALLAAMEEQYADVWAQLEVEKVGANGYSRLVTWRGSDPSLEPVLFVSHYDVVPVTPGTEGDWRYPPFSGALEEGYVWGRGTADVKIGVAGLLEAVMGLLRGGWTPARTVMLGLGHDEEVGGRLGAAKTAALLASRGVTLDIVVDEGGLVFEDGLKPFLPGRPVAMVATAEKGYTMIQVTLRSAGGHSSIPPIDGSSVMAQTWRLGAVLALAPPTPVLAEPVTDMLVAFVPYAPAWMRPLLAGAHSNKSWFVNRLLAWAFRRLLSADTSAFVTNTVALTRMAAGVADNVLPQEATLKFNVRILPGSSPEAVGEYFKWAVGAARVNGEVKVLMEHSNPPSMVTPATGRHFKLLKQAIQETWSEPGKPPLAVVPFLLTGGTDSKNYRNVTRNGILRFVPMGMNKTAGDLGRIHSTNERMKAEYFPRAVCTYMRMMQLMAGPAPAQG